MPVKDLGKGYSLVELDVGNEHLNSFGELHGGVYASAIDTAAYWGVYCELDEDVGLILLGIKGRVLRPGGKQEKGGKTADAI
jgi:acyl-coenzyme A thioesterase PaaI-like protein